MRGNETNPPKFLPPKNLILFISATIILLIFPHLTSQTSTRNPNTKSLKDSISHLTIKPFDCLVAPQVYPVVANTVEGLKFPFLYSLDKPHKNIVRTLKAKASAAPIYQPVQEMLGEIKPRNKGFLLTSALIWG